MLDSYSINNRGEILLSNRDSVRSGHGVWVGGEYRPLAACQVWQINNQGVVLAQTCDSRATDTWFLTPSPFGSTSVNSGKLAGAECEYPRVNGQPQRLSYGRMLNDSNEVVDSDNAWVTPAGCVRVGRVIAAMNSRGTLLVYPLAWHCLGVCDIPVEVLTMRGHIPLDSLLGAASAEYRVVNGIGINDSGQILGIVVRKSDNTRQAAFFSRIP